MMCHWARPVAKFSCKTEVNSVVCAFARGVGPYRHKHIDTKTSLRCLRTLLTMRSSGTFFRSAHFVLFLLRWRCREHFVSGCWHSSGRDYGRYPRECWLSALGVLHPGVPVMWYAHIRDLFPTAEGCMGWASTQCNVVTLGVPLRWCKAVKFGLFVNSDLVRVRRELLATTSGLRGHRCAEHHHLLPFGRLDEDLSHVFLHIQLVQALVTFIEHKLQQLIKLQILVSQARPGVPIKTCG